MTLSKLKIENFCMELRLAVQILYWDEVMMIPSQTIQATGKPVLCVPVLNTAVNNLL